MTEIANTTSLFDMFAAPFDLENLPAEIQAGISQAIVDAFTQLSASVLNGEIDLHQTLGVAPRDVWDKAADNLTRHLKDAQAAGDDVRAGYLATLLAAFLTALR